MQVKGRCEPRPEGSVRCKREVCGLEVVRGWGLGAGLGQEGVNVVGGAGKHPPHHYGSAVTCLSGERERERGVREGREDVTVGP